MMRSLVLVCLGVALATASRYDTYTPSTYTPPSLPPSYEYAPAYGSTGQHYGHAEHEPCPKHSRVHLPPVRIHFSEPGNVVLEGHANRIHNDVPHLTRSPGQMTALGESHISRTSFYDTPPTYVPSYAGTPPPPHVPSYAAPPPSPYVPSYQTPPPTQPPKTTTYVSPSYGPAPHHTTIMSHHYVQNPSASLLHSAHPHSFPSHHQDIVGAHLDAVSHVMASHDLAHSISPEHADATRKIAMGHAAAVQALTFGHPQGIPSSHHENAATGGQGRHIPILRFDELIQEGKRYSYSFHSGNGIHQQEETDVQFIPGGPHECEKALITKTGSVSYTSPEGIPVHMSFTADKDGFRPQGSHLPTVPR